ncbi:MAG: hypothetical protein WBN66_00745 [Smithella sp.]
MANFKKREIIILAIAALFIVSYVVYYFIADRLTGKKVQTGVGTETVETLTNTIAEDLNKNKLSDSENYIIKQAGGDWGSSPFLNRDLYRAWLAKDGAAAASALKIIYSGYIDSGKRRMAILNNVEYRIDEDLMEEGYVLKQITPSKVILYDKSSGSSIEIPIQE